MCLISPSMSTYRGFKCPVVLPSLNLGTPASVVSYPGFRRPLLSLTLDLGVPDDGADLFERLRAGPLHALVGVAQHLDQLRHDTRQAGGQLFGREERHRA